jgi:dTDP-4-dehydrorhamnose reductase
MMRVMVIGAAGQLGSAVTARLAKTAEVFPRKREDLDIVNEAAVLEAVTTLRPDAIVNCAAFTDVDASEEAPTRALEVNAFGVLGLARAASVVGATLVHYSTDFVFDGEADRPYVETDPTRPVNSYGASKLLGEWFAAETSAAYVLRVESLFGGEPARSSVDKILSAIRAGDPVRAFSDRSVTPSYVDDVAHATERLLAIRPACGVYHCVNSGASTWLGVAEEALRVIGGSAPLVPLTMADVKLKARRPRNCALSNQKLAEAGISMPTWQDALRRYCSTKS